MKKLSANTIMPQTMGNPMRNPIRNPKRNRKRNWMTGSILRRNARRRTGRRTRSPSPATSVFASFEGVIVVPLQSPLRCVGRQLAGPTLDIGQRHLWLTMGILPFSTISKEHALSYCARFTSRSFSIRIMRHGIVQLVKARRGDRHDHLSPSVGSRCIELVRRN